MIGLTKKVLDIYNQSIQEDLKFETLLDNKINIDQADSISSLKSIIMPIKKYLVLNKIDNNDDVLDGFIEKYFENEPEPYHNSFALLNDNCTYYKNLYTSWKDIKNHISSVKTPTDKIGDLFKKSTINLQKHNTYFKLTIYLISLDISKRRLEFKTHFDKKEVLEEIDKAISMDDKILELHAKALLLFINPSNKLYFKFKKKFLQSLQRTLDFSYQTLWKCTNQLL